MCGVELELGERGGADHAAIGDDADAGDQKAGLQPLGDRQEGGDVGGVAGPQLGTDWPPAAVDATASTICFKSGRGPSSGRIGRGSGRRCPRNRARRGGVEKD